MNSDTHSLIARYRSRGLVVDTNILMLLLVGGLSTGRIETFKRTRDRFEEDDYWLLSDLLNQFTRLVATPNVLAETSNLLRQLPRNEAEQAHQLLAGLVAQVDEQYMETLSLCRGDYAGAFLVAGVTDTGIIRLSRRGFLVLTDDLPLYSWLCRFGVDCLNFNHIRPVG